MVTALKPRADNVARMTIILLAHLTLTAIALAACAFNLLPERLA